ncbi:MAG: flagellar protein FlgN [Oryzomonas sp.]|uniref:flagellar protein FlgN n=1 Tax=Oryzomonas sp. TaxID=2855186 RepID=UPI00283EC35D|nr:flagellar protein FlgN [Oryzomonas sp.]MDR3579100.1 flagellar protein FlgN [Oryzomonas sp.]
MDTKTLEEKLFSQLQLYERLYHLLGEETGALAAMNLEDMENMTRQKNELSENIREADASLRQIISALAAERGFGPDVALATIAASTGKQKILQLCRKLAGTWQRIQEVSVINCTISKQFMKTAVLASDLMGNLINRSNMYGSSGGYVWNSSKSIMINKEA